MELSKVRGKGVVGATILNQEKNLNILVVPSSTSSGFMEGIYEMQNDNGDTFDVDIPQFSLDNPFEANKLN